MSRFALLAILWLAPGFAGVSWGQAITSARQDYPNRPIRLVLGFLAGGTTDAVARVMASQLQQQVGRNVVVDNRPGAGGVIGYNLVAKAIPDGYTLLWITSSFVTTASSYPNLPFDPQKDFAPVAVFARGVPNLVVVTPTFPGSSVKDLIALAKSSDKPLTYGSAGGIGTIQHFVAEMFSQRAGIKMLHVPYKGQGQALSALLSGEIQVMFLQPPVGVDFVKMGKLKALGFCGASRWSILPDVPTLSESGLPDFQIHGSYQGAIAPARTPRPILAKLHAEIKNTLNAQPVRDFFAAAGWEADGRGPDEFSAFLASELKRFGEIARVANIRIN